MASPSRSPSVARYSSSTSLSRSFSSATVLFFSGLMMYSGSKSASTLTPRRAHDSDLYFAGTSAAALGRSRMCPRRLDDVIGTQVTGYFTSLGGRLDYDESPHITVAAATAVPVCHQCLRSTLSIAYNARLRAQYAPRPRRQLTISHSARADAN